MNGEDMLRRIVEARELAEAAEEAVSDAEAPLVGRAWVAAKGCADLLEKIERDVRSELAAGLVIESSTRLRGVT